MTLKRRATPLSSLLGFAAAASVAYASSIHTFPAEIRKRNYVRLSTEKCDECMTLEEFYQSHPLGFVLFYERALMGGHKYKESIVSGWMEVCKELRFSRITCGMVDMVSDRAYAERYIDPKTAPAHIVVRKGQPVIALKKDIEPLMAKPGDKETMMAHVAELLKEDGTMGSLALSTHVNNKQALQRQLKGHRVAVVCFAGEDRTLAEAFRAAVQEAAFAHGLERHVQKDESQASRGRKGKGKRTVDKEKWRVAFVAAQGAGLGSQFWSVPDGDRSIGAFVNGTLYQLPVGITGTKPTAAGLIKAVQAVLAPALRAATGSDEGRRQDADKKTEL